MCITYHLKDTHSMESFPPQLQLSGVHSNHFSRNHTHSQQVVETESYTPCILQKRKIYITMYIVMETDIHHNVYLSWRQAHRHTDTHTDTHVHRLQCFTLFYVLPFQSYAFQKKVESNIGILRDE